ncbi:MAG: 4Fe-4S dicluster domain-containing protein [Deltaproteobacteria bacterium]|nr:4Fe-4S dicluster domain-containing protein [Deltaproteobacteria bacterium]
MNGKAVDRQQLDPNELLNLVGDDVRRWIKYEGELDGGFAGKVAKLAHGEKFFTCIQCGTCSATCPVSHYMDFTPRKIIAMVREGFKKEVLGSFTIWLCASCYSCTADCPKEIKITDVMYALKQMAIAEGVYPKRFPIPVMAKEFFRYVEKEGRNSEGRLMLNMSLKTNPFRLLRYAKMGLKLFLAGRVSLREESIKGKEGLHTLLRAVERAKEGAAK